MQVRSPPFYNVIRKRSWPVSIWNRRNTGDEVTKPNSAFERVKVDSLADSGSATIDQELARERGALQVTATAFLVLFCIVGLALWGLPFYYDFMVQQFGWTRAQVTSGNALSKLVVGPVFGFLAGWMVDRDRKSTRLNSSHGYISYAVFCLKKKKKQINQDRNILLQTS